MRTQLLTNTTRCIMSEDDWSCVEDWTVVNSLGDSTSDDWSILTSNENTSKDETLETPSFIANEHQVVSVVPTTNEMSSTDNEEPNDDSSAEPIQKRVRNGKRACKHSLVRRAESMYAFDSIGCQCSWYYGDFIEVVSRPLNENGRVPKTALDDVLPELVDDSTGATLGRSKRWAYIKTLLDQLEKDGIATCITGGKHISGMPHGMCRYGRYSSAPHELVHIVVKPNGSYDPRTRIGRYDRKTFDGSTVYHKHRGNYQVFYALNVERPPGVNAPPIRGSLRSLQSDDHGSRRAYTPGVATCCGASRSATRISAVQNAFAPKTVDLVFGRKVSVAFASIAGKIHNTTLETYEETTKSRHYPSGKIKRWRHVALEGTDSYCTRIEISARLALNPRIWVRLGSFDACQDGHTEIPIYLGDCDAALTDGTVECLSLRFRALSWHRRPLLRVGAYGRDENASSFTAKDKGAVGDGVEYVLHQSLVRETDQDISFQRKYGIKCGRSYGDGGWTSPKHKKAHKRSELRASMKEALEDYREAQS